MNCTTCDGTGSIFIEQDEDGRVVCLSCPECGGTEPEPEPTVLASDEDVPF